MRSGRELLAMTDGEDTPLTTAGPDDTGSDVFERFSYQALVAVPLCIDCLVGETIRAVFLEHYEDIAVKTADSWRFIQVKTRDLARGPWTLSDLLSASGALRSLLRTYEALSRDSPGLTYTLECHLEGAIKRGDPLEKLARGERGDCVPLVVAKLGISEAQCGEFLDRVVVRARLPSRETIRDVTRSYLAGLAPRARSQDIERVLETLRTAIHDAMMATRGFPFPEWVINVPSRDEEIRARIAAKRLDADRLRELVPDFAVGSRPLLRRLVGPERSTPSTLEIKLLAGGATAAVVEDAKSLRANAALRSTELLAAGGQEEMLGDLRERLKIRVHGEEARAGALSEPARRIWPATLDVFSREAAVIDANRLFDQDPMLLLGEACDLSDKCEITWGVPP